MDATEQTIDAAAAAVGLRIAAEHRSGVLHFYRLAQGMADSLMAIELDAADESGSVFVPVEPPPAEVGA